MEHDSETSASSASIMVRSTNLNSSLQGNNLKRLRTLGVVVTREIKGKCFNEHEFINPSRSKIFVFKSCSQLSILKTTIRRCQGDDIRPQK